MLAVALPTEHSEEMRTMKAAVFRPKQKAPGSFLRIEDVPRPQLESGHVLLRVVSCGVCRTDLHIVEGDLPPLQPQLIPGHQIVGEVVEGATPELPLGVRVGVSWVGGVDGDCWYCRHGMENLCDKPTFTGYTVNGGYAEYALARTDFTFPLPAGLDDVHVAPLLCAGIIGFRSLRVAGVEPGERVGIFGFGSSASLAITILQSWKCDVYVVTRGESHRKRGLVAWDMKISSPQDRSGRILDFRRIEAERLCSFAHGSKAPSSIAIAQGTEFFSRTFGDFNTVFRGR
jgi:propanol-preferring alcohol dehydrogenase